MRCTDPNKRQARIKEAFGLFESGMHKDEIAEKLGVDRGTISTYLREKGICRVHRCRESVMQRAVQMRESGSKLHEITGALRITLKTLNAYLYHAKRISKKRCKQCKTESIKLYGFKGQNICESCMNQDYEPSIYPGKGHSSIMNSEY